MNKSAFLRRMFYPAELLSIFSLMDRAPVKYFSLSPRGLCGGPRRLKLATGWLHFDTLPFWGQAFDDDEQYLSLHRWNWLLRALTDEEDDIRVEWGVSLVRSWISSMTIFPKGVAGEPYTSGERISNICLFFRHIQGTWTNLPADLVSCIRAMGFDLSRRVEYQDGELSGNHVVNNARSLLFAGHCTQTPELIEFGRVILAERLPKLVKSGFLREGSSHYQFLFTRWLLELMMLAREQEDYQTVVLIEPYLPQLIAACEFFRVESTNGDFLIPTFGDISPDAEPAWLNELPASALVRDGQASGRKGWARLFPDAQSMNIAQISRSGVWRAFPDVGWYRLDFADWVAIWHAESSGGAAIASHAHHDTCSLVLYRKGREVLIDPGRFDYSGSAFGNYGIGARSHNSVTLDDRSPMVSRGDRFLPARYREATCSVVHQGHDTKAVVQIIHNGFERLGRGIAAHKRTFTFRADKVLIQDVFEGSGSYRMEARFHQPLPDPTRFAAGMYDQLPAPLSFAMQMDSDQPEQIQQQFMIASESPLGGWRFPAYGIQEAALTQCFIGMIDLPAHFQYRLVGRGA